MFVRIFSGSSFGASVYIAHLTEVRPGHYVVGKLFTLDGKGGGLIGVGPDPLVPGATVSRDMVAKGGFAYGSCDSYDGCHACTGGTSWRILTPAEVVNEAASAKRPVVKKAILRLLQETGVSPNRLRRFRIERRQEAANRRAV